MSSSWGRVERAGAVAYRGSGLRWLLTVCGALGVVGCAYQELPECVAAGSPGDCEPLLEDLPPGTLTCAVSPGADAAAGACVPYVDAGWHTVLVRMAFLPKNLLRCPESAPNAGLYGVEIPDGGEMPRRVIGCSVNPFSSCPSPGLACVPFELDYPACVTQSGLHDCPAEYPAHTSVEEDGLGAEVTICCRRPPEPE